MDYENSDDDGFYNGDGSHSNAACNMEVESDGTERFDQTEPHHRQCHNCRRIETLNCPLQLRRCHRLVTQPFSLLPRNTEEAIVCKLCRRYLQMNLSNRHRNWPQMWTHGWASVIGFLLEDREHRLIRRDLWAMLPLIHRESWLQHAIDTGFSRDGLDDSDSLFEDYTLERERFYELQRSSDPADFIEMMDDFAFPIVKCALGCFAYVDETDEITFNHFLAWKFDLNIFDGDAKKLNAARNNWPPKPKVHLNAFIVSAGVVITESKGLCVLVCDHHGKSLLQKFVHVPEHPVLRIGSNPLGFQQPDICSAATLTLNIKRRP